MTFLLYVPQNDKNSIESLMPLHQHDSQKSLKEKMEQKEENSRNTFDQICAFWYF